MTSTLLDPDGNRLVDVQRARAAGRPVVGIVGAVVPVELVLASGCFPVALMARASDWGDSTEFMEDGHEPEVRSLFMQAVGGEFEGCDLVVIPSSSDGYRYLFQYLKEMQRQGLGERVPPLFLFDFLFGQGDAVRRYSLRAFGLLADRLAILADHRWTAPELGRAIGSTNDLRVQFSRLGTLRTAGRASGVEAHRLVRTSVDAVDARQSDRVEASLSALTASAPQQPGPRLLAVSAVPLYHEALHAAVERAGAVITAEDDEWGARRAGPLVDAETPTLETLHDHYARHAISPRMLLEEREAWTRQQMQSGNYEGVVFYIPPSDQFFGWRYPALKAWAEQCGLPSTVVSQDVLDPAATVDVALAGFVASLARSAEGTR